MNYFHATNIAKTYMADKKTLKEIIREVKFKYNLNQKQIAGQLGVQPTYLSDAINGRVPFSDSLKDKIHELYSDCISIELGSESSSPALKSDAIYIPLLPISAQGGSLNDFVVSIKDNDCEKIISPIKGADFAMTVSGDSMAPEYPSGSKILIKKINERSFIEWGRCYVLDTCNGTVIKKLDAPTEPDEQYGMDYVTCVSVNPNPIYKPFRVSTKDIYGMYRVLLLLTEK